MKFISLIFWRENLSMYRIKQWTKFNEKHHKSWQTVIVKKETLYIAKIMPCQVFVRSYFPKGKGLVDY